MIAYALAVLMAVLPMPGTQFKQLPDGPGKAEVEASCYACHSADLIVQQRLTEKQWIASVEKMARWGASDVNKEVMVKYLSRHFGPSNRFVPTKTAPIR